MGLFIEPAYLTAAQDWLICNLKTTIDDHGTIDFGTTKYVQFVATVDASNSSSSDTDDMFNIETKYAISLNSHKSSKKIDNTLRYWNQRRFVSDCHIG